MAVNDGFNTTTLTFGTGVTTPLTSVSYSNSASEIDVTGSADVVHYYETGLSNPTITCETVGVSSAGAVGATPTLTAGTTATLVVTLNNSTGTVEVFNGSALLSSIERGGSLDGELTTSMTFRPAQT